MVCSYSDSTMIYGSQETLLQSSRHALRFRFILCPGRLFNWVICSIYPNLDQYRQGHMLSAPRETFIGPEVDGQLPLWTRIGVKVS